MDETENTLNKIAAIISLVIIILALNGNTICFLVFRFSKEFNKIPAMIYLSFLAVIDTLTLFTWNLDHFIDEFFKLKMEELNDFSCKFLIFLQMFSMQSSGILLTVMCIDRFVTIISTPGSFYSKLPFSTKKTAFIWSLSIIAFFFIFNIHILILNTHQISIKNETYTDVFINTTKIENRTSQGILLNIEYYNNTYFINKTREVVVKGPFLCNIYPNGFQLFPTWENVNMVIYTVIPSTLMFIFNLLLITKTLMVNSSMKNNKSKEVLKANAKKRRLTISILTITFLYMLMITPNTIIFGFYFMTVLSKQYGWFILVMVDNLAFAYHANLFFTCFLSNVKFRRYIIQKINRYILCRMVQNNKSRTNAEKTNNTIA